jgi:hypothetical protein
LPHFKEAAALVHVWDLVAWSKNSSLFLKHPNPKNAPTHFNNCRAAIPAQKSKIFAC